MVAQAERPLRTRHHAGSTTAGMGGPAFVEADTAQNGCVAQGQSDVVVTEAMRISRDREHGFHRIMSNDFRGS